MASDPMSDPFPYQPKDAVGASLKGTMITGAAGLFISAIQNSLTKQNVSAMSVFSRTGGTIAVFAAMGGAHEFVRNASANLRQRDDSWNPTFGGFVAGAVLGLRFRTMPSVMGYGAGLAVAMGVFDYTGGRLTGYPKDHEVDEFERKEALRKNRRRPVQEIVEELGEGRGIYGPGYQERRRERLRDKYGIEIPTRTSSET